MDRRTSILAILFPSLNALGFQLVRISGSDHIFANEDIDEQINLQPDKGKAKGYQVRQVAKIIKEHDLQVK